MKVTNPPGEIPAAIVAEFRTDGPPGPNVAVRSNFTCGGFDPVPLAASTVKAPGAAGAITVVEALPITSATTEAAPTDPVGLLSTKSTVA